MLDFRQFEAGPDPFGRKWQVSFKWLLTAISLRHSDSVDVKFVLQHEQTRSEKTIALMHPDLLRLSRARRRDLTDPWCARLAAEHLRQVIETGEDLEKDLVTVLPEQLERYAEAIEREEKAAIEARVRGAA